MRKGIIVKVHDPYVKEYYGVPLTDNLNAAMKNADAVVIFTGHDCYKKLDPETIRILSGKLHPVIIDGRNVIDADKFIQHGFVYRGIGRGDKNREVQMYRRKR
jgi:UDP-N-acetyl-D-mannosaminuronic acid dehydrogenase